MSLLHSIKNYFVEAYQEIRRVVWPTRDTVVRYTILVIILSLLVAAFLGTLDIFFKDAVEKIIGT